MDFFPISLLFVVSFKKSACCCAKVIVNFLQLFISRCSKELFVLRYFDFDTLINTSYPVFFLNLSYCKCFEVNTVTASNVGAIGTCTIGTSMKRHLNSDECRRNMGRIINEAHYESTRTSVMENFCKKLLKVH